MTEFHDKAMSAWSSCAERKEMACTHRQWAQRANYRSWTIFWAQRRICATRASATEKKCAAPWITILKTPSRSKEKSCAVKKRTRTWTGWRPQDDEQEEMLKKMVLQKGDGELVKSLATIQENKESAAKEVAHTT